MDNLIKKILLRSQIVTSRVNEYENRLDKLEKNIVTKNELLKMMNSFIDQNKSKEILILNGKSVEANLAYQNLYSTSQKSIYIIDNYIGLKTLINLKNIENVDIYIFSNNLNKTLHREEIIEFKKEYPNVKIKFKKISNIIHDRYIIIDYNTDKEKIYHCGASSKDAGKKISTIIEINDTNRYHEIFDKLFKFEKSLI